MIQYLEISFLIKLLKMKKCKEKFFIVRKISLIKQQREKKGQKHSTAREKVWIKIEKDWIK